MTAAPVWPYYVAATDTQEIPRVAPADEPPTTPMHPVFDPRPPVPPRLPRRLRRRAAANLALAATSAAGFATAIGAVTL